MSAYRLQRSAFINPIFPKRERVQGMAAIVRPLGDLSPLEELRAFSEVLHEPSNTPARRACRRDGQVLSSAIGVYFAERTSRKATHSAGN